jgi:hypothetical protein
MSQHVAHAEELQLLQVRRAGCHGQASFRAASRLSWQQACELPIDDLSSRTRPVPDPGMQQPSAKARWHGQPSRSRRQFWSADLNAEPTGAPMARSEGCSHYGRLMLNIARYMANSLCSRYGTGLPRTSNAAA